MDEEYRMIQNDLCFYPINEKDKIMDDDSNDDEHLNEKMR